MKFAKDMFLHVSVILSTGGRGGAIPSCIAGGIPACLAAGLGGGGIPACLEGFQANTQGGKLRGSGLGVSRPTPGRGVPAAGGSAPKGVCVENPPPVKPTALKRKFLLNLNSIDSHYEAKFVLIFRYIILLQ